METLSIHTEYIPALCSPPSLFQLPPLPTHSSTTVSAWCAPSPPKFTVPFPPTPPPTTVCGPLLCRWLQAANPSSRLPTDSPLSSSASNWVGTEGEEFVGGRLCLATHHVFMWWGTHAEAKRRMSRGEG